MNKETKDQIAAVMLLHGTPEQQEEAIIHCSTLKIDGVAIDEDDVVYKLLKRAQIRKNIPHRKSVQEGKPDRISDLLEEAAAEIIKLRKFQK